MKLNHIYHGNNLDILKTFENNSIDSIVTDPPYGISFMNKKWDYDVPTVEFWIEALRVLKPGGHALVACGTRTQHRMAVNLEDAGFEIRDIVAWVYGSGFPKSHDVSLSIDKLLGESNRGHRVSTASRHHPDGTYEPNGENLSPYKAKREEAKQWQGWGTALKPAMELWTLCRKPLQGTVANNVLKYGVGGINIDGCRVETDDTWNRDEKETNTAVEYQRKNKSMYAQKNNAEMHDKGRFPANFIHDGSEEVVKLFPNTEQGGSITKTYEDKALLYGDYKFKEPFESYGDSGSAARFFYTAKASQTERNWGLNEFDSKFTASAEFRPNHMEKAIEGESGNPYGRWQPKKNIHPTVKPIDLMRYLVRLITPKGGVCLDPFMGSGTTAVACKAEKFDYIGCEIDADYIKISEARIKAEAVIYDIFDFGA